MTNESQPLDRREQTIADVRALLDFLAARPDVPLNPFGDPLSYPVLTDDDAAGIAEITRIAASLGVPVTSTNGKPATPESSHLLAEYRVGQAVYSACYIHRAWMKQRDEEQRWVAERRKAAES